MCSSNPATPPHLRAHNSGSSCNCPGRPAPRHRLLQRDPTAQSIPAAPLGGLSRLFPEARSRPLPLSSLEAPSALLDQPRRSTQLGHLLRWLPSLRLALAAPGVRLRRLLLPGLSPPARCRVSRGARSGRSPCCRIAP